MILKPIVMFDDSEMWLELVKTLLAHTGRTFIGVHSNIKTALSFTELLTRIQPAVVIIDLHTGTGLDGDMLILKCKTSTGLLRCKYLLLSGDSNADLKMRAVKCSADGYVKKGNNTLLVNTVLSFLQSATL